MFKAIILAFALVLTFVSSVNAQTVDYEAFMAGKKIGTAIVIKNGDNHEMAIEVNGVKEIGSISRSGLFLVLSKNGQPFIHVGLGDEPIYHKHIGKMRHLVGQTVRGEEVKITNHYLGNGRYIDVTKINGKVYERSESLIDQNDLPIWVYSRKGDNTQEIAILRK